MRDVMQPAQSWLEKGERVAMATVVETWGSGPRRPGAKLVVSVSDTSDGEPKLAGSVSGGCVENAVVETAQAVLSSGTPELIEFGVSDEMAWEVGLSCGGRIQIFVEELNKAPFEWWKERLGAEKAVASATVVKTGERQLGMHLLMDQDGERHGELVDDAELVQLVEEQLRLGRTARVETSKGLDVLVDVELPAPVLALVGGVHVSIALASMAKTLGYRVAIVDPRSAFANRERFPNVDYLLVDWPEQALTSLGTHRSTAIATLTHDPKLDDPALMFALKSDAFYVGALGSRRTHAKRVKRLSEQGLSDELIERVRAPIGLAIGSQSPEEIALSIMAEVSAARRGAL